MQSYFTDEEIGLERLGPFRKVAVTVRDRIQIYLNLTKSMLTTTSLYCPPIKLNYGLWSMMCITDMKMPTKSNLNLKQASNLKVNLWSDYLFNKVLIQQEDIIYK